MTPPIIPGEWRDHALLRVRGVAAGDLRAVKAHDEADLAGTYAGAAVGHLGHLDATIHRSGHGVCWSAKRVRAPPRQRGVDCRGDFGSPRPTGTALHRNHRGAGRNEIWVTHGQEDALVHWCRQRASPRVVRSGRTR